jgi:hypothetical protein
LQSKQQYLLNKNIKKINKDNLYFKAYLTSAKQDDNLLADLISNKYSFRYKYNDKEINITAQNNPQDICKVIIDTEYERRIKSKKFKSSITAIAFVLDPYIVDELLKKYTWVQYFYFVFPSANYFASLLSYFDFTEIFNNPNFKPVFNNDTSIAVNILRSFVTSSAFSFTGLNYFIYSPFDLLFNDLFTKAKNEITVLSDHIKVNMHTKILLGKHMDENEIRALDKILKYPTVKILKNKLIGKPVICVAAGPSLGKQLDFLKKIQNEVFIIAVAAVAKTLIDYGIKPNLLTIIDMQPFVIEQLKKIDTSDIPIVIEMSCHHSVTEELKANFIFSLSAITNQSYLIGLLVAMGIQPTNEDYLMSGFTVAITSMMCAQFMGASEVFLLGQDLAMGEKSSHVDGTILSSKIEIIKDANNKQYFKNISNYNSTLTYIEAKEVPGYYGDIVYTTDSFMAFINFFRDIIKSNKFDNVYNSTEGGAYIDGAKNISLEEAYNKFIKNNKSSKDELALYKPKRVYKKNVKESIDNLEKVIEKMQEAKDLATEGIDLLLEFREKHKKNNKEYVDELTMKVYVEKINNIADTLNKKYVYEVNSLSQMSEVNFYLTKILNNINTHDYTEEAKLADMLNKFVLFFANVKDGMDNFIKELNTLIASLKENYLNKKSKVRRKNV